MYSQENSTKPQYKDSQEDIVHVLCIDDEKDFLSLIRRSLEKLSYGRIKAEISFSAKQALDLLEKKSIDVIVSDYQMPEMNGLELLTELRKQGNTVPFIILTGRGKEEVVIQALNMGADFYLQKGGDVKTLFTELVHFIMISTDLRKSEKSYQDLYENAPDMFVSVDTKTGKIILCNQTLVTCLGYSKKELINYPVFEIYHPDCLEEAKRLFQLFKEMGVIKDAELLLKRKDGRKIPVSLNVSAERDVHGNVLYSRSILRDITKLKQVEKSLLEIDQRYQALFKSSNIAIFTGKSLDNVILDANQTVAKMLGYEIDELIGLPFKQIVDSSEFDNVDQKIISLRSGIKTSGHYRLLIKKEGTKLPVKIKPVMIYDQEGQPLYIQSVISNLSILHELTLDNLNLDEALKALKESKERLRDFMESATENFALFDLNLNIIDVNKGTMKSLFPNLNKEDVVGKNITDIIPNLKETGRYNQYLEVIRTGNPIYFDNIILHSRFGDFNLEIRAFKVGTGMGMITTDVTKRTKAEDLLRHQKQELSEFVHQINHDTRSGLFSIQGYAELLEEKGENDLAPKIIRITKKIQELLKRSVELSDAGLVAKKTDIVNLNDIIKKVAQDVLPENISISSTDLPSMFCDRLKMTQIFQNLFENAVIHGKATKIEVISDQNSILIRNDGIPIPEDHRSKIFQKGFTTIEGNSGLGLNIVKKIVEAHSWTITLKSDETTIFCIHTSPPES
ncbi:MAG: Sporulation kinase E [Candidatus Heimdallarchaeota archaeon LC_3]|nr:MAG: Sporulation kinase E [Candidatus Heimdallarchaeota archaeon LC_3]OLS26540.1 MAG: Sporulation kinase E [Candidatus Heimdallarchaeota archaeon LC_3]